MAVWNLPDGCSLNEIDALFSDESDEFENVLPDEQAQGEWVVELDEEEEAVHCFLIKCEESRSGTMDDVVDEARQQMECEATVDYYASLAIAEED